MTSEDPDQRYSLADWAPPWRDNGDRLLEMIEGLRELQDEASWQIIGVLLVRQLQADLALERAINEIEAAVNAEPT